MQLPSPLLIKLVVQVWHWSNDVGHDVHPFLQGTQANVLASEK